MTATDPSDPLAELREQIRATTAAAERLAAETAQARADADADAKPANGTGTRTPPAGWATTEEQHARQHELQSLIALVEALRDLVPPELKEQVRDVVRQVLLLLRALVDWWVERIEGPRPTRAATGPTVEEIPVD